MVVFFNLWFVGIDVMFSGGDNLCVYVLDVNLFGDLLYYVEYNGFGIYEWEMDILWKEFYKYVWYEYYCWFLWFVNDYFGYVKIWCSEVGGSELF